MIDAIETLHVYPFRGRALPSVTHILGAVGILRGFGDEADLARGRAAHEATRMWDQGTLISRSVDPAIEGYLESWKRLRECKKFRILTMERKVVCPRMGCGGRYDLDILMDGERFILDKKTGEIQDEAARLQLVAYAEMKRRSIRHRSEPHGRIAVRLFADGGMAIMHRYKATDYQRDLRAWLSAVNLFQWRTSI